MSIPQPANAIVAVCKIGIVPAFLFLQETYIELIKSIGATKNSSGKNNIPRPKIGKAKKPKRHNTAPVNRILVYYHSYLWLFN